VNDMVNDRRQGRAQPGGFSLVEVIVAMVILAAALLAMAASMGAVATQVNVAKLRTERSAAVQQVIEEELHGRAFGELATRPQNQAVPVGRFQAWWTVELQGTNLRRVTIVTRGPGYSSAVRGITQVDETFVATIAN
jgi:prepilin-type N-terminal cleavage/methylation domain-containing protein